MLKGLRKILSTIAFVALSTPMAFPQQMQAVLSHYSTSDGLCSNAVSDIKQDDYGYIWIATWNGLSRYDGYSFYNYPTGPASNIPLLHNRIQQLAVDLGQNIWMRMYDGRVFMLDRVHDRIVNPFDGIAGHESYKTRTPIKTMSNGDILIEVEDIGVYIMKYSRNGIQRKLIDTRKYTVTAMAEGYHGDVWAGTNKGIRRLNITDEMIGSIADFPDENITCMYSNGYSVYAGTASGKILRTGYGQTPTVVAETGAPLTSLYIDGYGLIWYSNKSMGVTRINKNGESKTFSQVVKNPEFDALGARFSEINGILWMTLSQGGFGYYNRTLDEVEYFHNDPLESWSLSNTVAAFLVLPEGVIWESTSRRGLEKLDLMHKTISRTQLFPTVENTNANEIRAMYYDSEKKTLLVGNKLSQLLVIRGGSRLELHGDSKGFPFGRIYGISKDRHGNYWISTKGNGLFKMTPIGSGFTVKNYRNNPRDKWSLSNDNVYASIEDNQGNIWVATYGGGVNILTKTDKGREIFINTVNSMHNYPQQAYMKVRSLTLDKQGLVWVGSTDGILTMSFHNGYVLLQEISKSMSKEFPIGSCDIVTLACQDDGTIWIGTNGGGLSKYLGKDKHNLVKFQNFNSQTDGLPSDEIKSITFDKRGNVWFASDNIIGSFDSKKHIFTTYSMLDGVDETRCSEAAAVTLSDGTVLIGTLDGYYTINSKRLVDTDNPMLKLRITNVYVNEQLMSPRLNDLYKYYLPDGKRIELPTHSSSFSVEFSSLNYRLQHRVHYQYKLVGYDTSWKNATRDRTASYNNLPAGTYTLQVKAFLLEQPDKSEIKTIEIVVPPMFLFSSSAVWIYMVLIAILLLYGFYLRQRSILKREIANGNYQNRTEENENNKSEDTDKEDTAPKQEEVSEAEYIDVETVDE